MTENDNHKGLTKNYEFYFFVINIIGWYARWIWKKVAEEWLELGPISKPISFQNKKPPIPRRFIQSLPNDF